MTAMYGQEIYEQRIEALEKRVSMLVYWVSVFGGGMSYLLADKFFG